MKRGRATGRLTVALVLAGCAPEPPPGSELGDPPVSQAQAAANAAVVELLDTTPLVGIGEPHRNVQAHEFLDGLVRDQAVLDAVDAVVVEFANAFYQELLDRYVAGGSVPDDSLPLIWRTTTQIHGVWDAPMYGAFIRTMREVNATRPVDNRVRVLAGDPPLDWDVVDTREELRAVTGRRRSHYAAVAERVLARGERALVIVGGRHLDRTRPGSVAARLTARYPGALYVVQPILGDSAWARWRGRLAPLDVPEVLPVRGGWYRASDADAGLYLGPPASLTVASPPASLANDVEYCAGYRERWERLTSLPPDRSHPCWDEAH